MATEPSGAVESPSSLPLRAKLLTFLIADVRGYTRFTVEQGDEAAARLAGRFAAIAKRIAATRDGEVIELRGDEALAVFTSARQALRAALDLQEHFSQERAADPSLPLQVGIGLDAGEAIPVDGGYRGGALNLAARLCSLAGAGEVFCSETLIGLARKTEGIAFVDRGEVTLKGLTEPIRVIQIVPEGELPDSLPPLQSVLVTHPNNLPDEPTPFIGREREIEQIAELLHVPHIRLVTLTGPAGTGKTRLALQVGNTLLHDFRDGVFFVNLAPLADPTLVPSAIAEVLGVQEAAERGLVETLARALQDKRVLLVLDNFEHLLDGSSLVSSLLDGCRELHLLVTSRIPLHLSREHEHLVPPLSVPDPDRLPDLGALTQYEAVALFVERARSSKDSFTVTDDNAPAVAEICYRLDGLPLAIELAAARIKLFPPQALLQRLSSRLKLLTGGARDRPSRHQTLRGAIDWSYFLLTEEEQVLFVRLSVFVGGCSFEAAEAVCNPDGDLDLVDGIASLVDKSLLRQEGDEEPRFRMLETIRENAAERLGGDELGKQIRQKHAEYFLTLVDTGERDYNAVVETAWMDRAEREQDNLRAALRWLLDAGEDEMVMRLALMLTRFWMARGSFAEIERWLDETLTRAGGAPAVLRATAYADLGWVVMRRREFERGTAVLGESLRLFTEAGDERGAALARRVMVGPLLQQGQVDQATRLLGENLIVCRELNDRGGIAQNLHLLGEAALNRGDYEEAIALTEESIALHREREDNRMLAYSLENLARAVLAHGNPEQAALLWEESLRLAEARHDRYTIAGALLGLAGASAQRGQAERAARLSGAADRVYREIGIPLSPPERAIAERFLAPARSRLGEAAWATEYRRGESLSLEDAVHLALQYTGKSYKIAETSP